ncbi:MAG: DNA polymerase III subunit gamma and tau, partial [Propionibacteriaceae bacterium]
NAGARDSFAKGGSEDVLREALIVVLGADLRIEAMVDSGSAGIQPAPAPRSTAPERAQASWDAPPASASDSAPPPAAAHVAAGSPSPDRVALPPDPESSAPVPAPASSSDPALRAQARQLIRPTRQGAGPDADAVDDRDAIADRRDGDLEESAESHTELLARHLGAEIIAEEEHGA